MLPIGHYFFLSFGLLLIGIVGALLRRNPALVAMSIALIATGAAINFVTFSRFFGEPSGQNFALILCFVALAEAIVFAALIAKHSSTDESALAPPEVAIESTREPQQTDHAE